MSRSKNQSKAVSNSIHYKMFQTKATSIDEENFNITFKISDGSIDRDGEIVSQKDWRMANYMANPVLLFGHNPSKPQFVLGKCLSIEYDVDNDCHYGTYHLDAGFNEDAKLVWNQLVSGTIRTVSLGFINHSEEYSEKALMLTEIEPLETSIVAIPANAGALAKAYKAKKLSRKDAVFLMKTMRSEAELIEKQMEVDDRPKPKEKSMTDEQAQSVLDGIAKLNEKVDTLTSENAELKQQLAELKPPAETDEEKATREAAEKEAADKAEAEAKAAAEAEAAKKADEEAKAKQDAEDAAKGGKIDQPGAPDDIDEDAELTPELQALIDAELEPAAAV